MKKNKIIILFFMMILSIISWGQYPEIGCDTSSHTTSSFNSLLGAGNIIGNHNNGSGSISILRETNTTLSFDIPNGILTFVNESGNNAPIDLSSLGVNSQSRNQDNTGNSIPATLVNPTNPVLPIDGDLTLQEYDDGFVISIFNGTWTNKELGSASMVNIYTDDGTLDEERNVDLATFDLDFETSTRPNLFTLDASSGRVGVNANQNETFGQLHVKGDSGGADNAVLSLANNTNQQIWRQRNDGGFRANTYGQGNQSWTDLGVTPTNYTLGISDDGTMFEINGDTITRQWHYLDANNTLQGTTDTTAIAYPILSEVDGMTITSIELMEYVQLPLQGVSLRAMLFRPSAGTYTDIGDIVINSGNVGIVENLSTVVAKGDQIYIRELLTDPASVGWRGLDMEIRFLK